MSARVSKSHRLLSTVLVSMVCCASGCTPIPIVNDAGDKCSEDSVSGTLTGGVIGTITKGGVTLSGVTVAGDASYTFMLDATTASQLKVTSPSGTNASSDSLTSSLIFFARPAVGTYTQTSTTLCGNVELSLTRGATSTVYAAGTSGYDSCSSPGSSCMKPSDCTSTQSCTAGRCETTAVGAFSLTLTSVTTCVPASAGSGEVIYTAHGTLTGTLNDTSGGSTPDGSTPDGSTPDGGATDGGTTGGGTTVTLSLTF
jgi:hypothetical protein